uniref:Uncharacterized protein n=1 Tax=Octopus bimaculoides TaxID=37653 RepID=A0A0L8GVU5_OCTBM
MVRPLEVSCSKKDILEFDYFRNSFLCCICVYIQYSVLDIYPSSVWKIYFFSEQQKKYEFGKAEFVFGRSKYVNNGDIYDNIGGD